MSSMLSIWKGVSDQLTPRPSAHAGTARETNPFDRPAVLGEAGSSTPAMGSSSPSKGSKGTSLNGGEGVAARGGGSPELTDGRGTGQDDVTAGQAQPRTGAEGQSSSKPASKGGLANLGFHLPHLSSAKRTLDPPRVSFDESGARTPLARTPMASPGSSPVEVPGAGGSFFAGAPPEAGAATNPAAADARHHQRIPSGGRGAGGAMALKAPQTTSVSRAIPDFTFKASPISRAKNVLRDSVGAVTHAGQSGLGNGGIMKGADGSIGPAKAKDATATARTPTSSSFAAHRALVGASDPPSTLGLNAEAPIDPLDPAPDGAQTMGRPQSATPAASSTPRSAPVPIPSCSKLGHKARGESNGGSNALPTPRGLLSVKLVSARNLATKHFARPYIVASYDNSEFVSREPIAEEVGEERGVAASKQRYKKDTTLSTDGKGPPGSRESAAAADRAKQIESNGNGVYCLSGQNPIWKNEVDFDVVSHPTGDVEPTRGKVDVHSETSRTLTLSVYDRSVGDDDEVGGVEGIELFLGEVEIDLDFDSLSAREGFTDNWYKLHALGGDVPVTGDVRVQLRYKEFASRRGLSVNDFDFLKMIGRGTFGRVFQVRKKDTKRIYAMKVLSKKEVIAKKEVQHTLGERNILQRSSECAFLLGLKFSFQSPGELFLVMDYKSGGELFHHLQKEGRFTEERARFYTAEIVLAFEHLHKYDIVYRDLKPENILLDATGHIVLCDFGLSKPDLPSDALTTTFCGTTEYLAPEVLLDDHGYSKLVDFWSLGVLLFEMCCGWSPFYAEDTQQMYKNICFGKIKFPRGVIGDEGKHFVKGLLNRNPRHRLGAQRDAQELKEHGFFSNIDWVALEARQVAPPFKPFVDSDESVANFDAEFTEADILKEMPLPALDDNDRSADWIQHVSGSAPSPRDLPAPRRRSQDSMSEQFRGFSYAGESEMHFPSSRFAMTSIG